MTDKEQVEIASLVGMRKLTGVDRETESIQHYDWRAAEDCNVLRFRLDGVVYCAIEDPDDGYRSAMGSLVIDKTPINNKFKPVKVLATLGDGDADTLVLTDVKTGKVVLEVGTDNSDSYYPCFVDRFDPENMAINAK